MEENNKNYWVAMEEFPEPYQALFREEERLIDVYIGKNDRVLDVGCGDGRILRQLAPKTNNLIGIDHDEPTVSRARKELVDLPFISVKHCEGSNLPFDDEYFDKVLCMGTFTNLGEERPQVLREMKRVLSRNGLMIITAYSEDALDDRLELYRGSSIEIKEVRPDGTVLFEGSVDSISEQFSRDQLEFIISGADLKIRELKKVGIVYSGILER